MARLKTQINGSPIEIFSPMAVLVLCEDSLIEFAY
jgi:hypothetical protein